MGIQSRREDRSDQVRLAHLELLTPSTLLVLLRVLPPPAAATSADDLVDTGVADVECGQQDQEGEGEGEEDQEAGGDDLGEGTGTHLVYLEIHCDYT